MTRKLAKPIGDQIVIDPATGHPMSPEGRVVDVTSHWTRRARDGEIELLDVPDEEPETAAPKTTKPGRGKAAKPPATD